jgi:hypothetical protein
MWQALAIGTDFIHAISMAVWFAGLPLLFWHAWPTLTRDYAIYAVVFVVVSQASQWLLGECFLTSIALFFWEHVPSSAPVSKDWFTVRIAQAVFHTAPSHRGITRVSEGMIIVAAVGALTSLHRLRLAARAKSAVDAPHMGAAVGITLRRLQSPTAPPRS